MIFPSGRKSIISILSIVLVCAVGVVSWPEQASAKTHHKKHHVTHAAVDRTASYADIVIDAETGQILHATNPDRLRHPASLTKMMTLYITFQALEAGKIGYNQYLPISANAAEQAPSKLGLRPGQRIRVEDAILGLVTESANDAAVVLAEWLGGSEHGFAQLMTRQARALGMTRTNFDNPSGLPDDGQITTARDMAILGDALIHHYPQFYPFFSRDSFTYAGLYHHNHNHLMDRYDGMDGIKTGYIRASGFNLVASAKRGNVRLIGVVFGGHSAVARDNQMAQLLDEAFDKAQKDRTDNRTASRQPAVQQDQTDGAQGDSNDNAVENVQYVTLPAKVAAIFPSQNEVPERKPQPQAAPPEMVAVTTNGWGVQIGAYSDPVIGRQALVNAVAGAPTLLGKAERQLVPTSTTSGGVVYRARLVNIDAKTAQDACVTLIHQGINCLPVGTQ